MLSFLSFMPVTVAYGSYPRSSEATVDEFQRRVKTMQDQDTKQWIVSTLPDLQTPRKKMRQVNYSLQTNP